MHVRVFVYVYLCNICIYLYLQLFWVGSCSHSVSKNAVFQSTNQSGQSSSGFVDSVHVGWYVVYYVVYYEMQSVHTRYVYVYMCVDVYICVWVYMCVYVLHTVGSR